MTQNLYRRDALASSAAALYALSLLPGAQAYCYIDGFGVERCTLSTGVRVAIAVASVVAVLALLLGLRSMRARSQRRANLMYVGTVPANGAPGQAPPAYPAQGPGGYYAPNGAYTPQYPPQTYQQSPYSSPYPPPGNLPQYAPPPGPPPAQGDVPQYYAPPPGPPPATDQKI